MMQAGACLSGGAITREELKQYRMPPPPASLDEAIAAYRTALRLDDDHLDARYGLGVALLRNGATAEATRELEAYFELAGDRLRIVVRGVAHWIGVWGTGLADGGRVGRLSRLSAG